METPVALIIFNRPETTKRVLAEVAKAKPRKLFVIADGPRADRPDESVKCSEVRAIIDLVDWDCQVHKNYSDVNLGCGRRPASGISWVFDQVEEAIILEDDCLPHPSFFRYCQELLARYRNEPKIMQIAGTTFARNRWQLPHSYTFSSHLACWGWATWRRAWKNHDMACSSWPALRNESRMRDWLDNQPAIEFYSKFFDLAFSKQGNVGYWDYQWQLAVWAQAGLSVSPARNLVSNIGFGADASHTFGAADKRANLPRGEMRFPLVHPPTIARDECADREFIEQAVLPFLAQPENLYYKMRRNLVDMLPDNLRAVLRILRERLN